MRNRPCNMGDEGEWECGQCKYDNEPEEYKCQQCGRPEDFVGCPDCAPGAKRRKLYHGGWHNKQVVYTNKDRAPLVCPKCCKTGFQTGVAIHLAKCLRPVLARIPRDRVSSTAGSNLVAA